jgi:hypothetical protein
MRWADALLACCYPKTIAIRAEFYGALQVGSVEITVADKLVQSCNDVLVRMTGKPH